jgi:hypothetical protein
MKEEVRPWTELPKTPLSLKAGPSCGISSGNDFFGIFNDMWEDMKND